MAASCDPGYNLPDGCTDAAIDRLTSDEGRDMQITLNFGWPQAIMTCIYAWNAIYAVLWWGGFYG